MRNLGERERAKLVRSVLISASAPATTPATNIYASGGNSGGDLLRTVPYLVVRSSMGGTSLPYAVCTSTEVPSMWSTSLSQASADVSSCFLAGSLDSTLLKPRPSASHLSLFCINEV